MKKVVVLIMVVFFCPLSYASAQHGREQVENAKIALITKRLSLTPETAQKFWPVYNRLWEENKALRKEEFKLRRTAKSDSLTDDQAQQMLDQLYNLKEKQSALELSMFNSFKNILTPVQMVQLMKAEEDFRLMVVDKLRERHRGDNDSRQTHRRR